MIFITCVNRVNATVGCCISVTQCFPRKLTKAELCLWLLLRCGFTHLRGEERRKEGEEKKRGVFLIFDVYLTETVQGGAVSTTVH